MKFVLATDSFKESMTSIEACSIMVSFFVQDCEIYEELP